MPSDRADEPPERSLPLDTTTFTQPREELVLLKGDPLERLVDSIAGSFAARLRSDDTAPGDTIVVTYIGEAAATERLISSRTGGVSARRDGSETIFLSLTWEDYADALAFERGESDLVALLTGFRATLRGEPEAMNWFASHFVRPGELESSGLVPFVSRTVSYSDEHLSSLMKSIGADRLLFTMAAAFAELWTMTNLYKETGPHVTRLAIEGVASHAVECAEDGCRVLEPGRSQADLHVVWPDQITFARYLGTEETFSSLYLGERLKIEGNLAIAHAWSRVTPAT